MDAADLTSRFPGLSRLETGILATLAQSAQELRIPAGTRIFGPGHPPAAYLLLVQGTVRVQQVSEGGREIVLYRVSAGESCTLTTACLLGYEDYQAEGMTETEVDALAVPRPAFDDLIARSAEFRRFVFSAFSSRISNLFRLIEEVAFSRIDVRLAQRLLELADARGRVALTHQQLASELGTAREVISRQLHEFQRRGWIATSRGAIDISDCAGLRQLAAAP
jgi:CRP/FNR family transcriptional regulator